MRALWQKSNHILHKLANYGTMMTATILATGALSLPAQAGLVAGDEDVTPANHNPTLQFDGPATNGPAKASPWAYSAKQGIGTAYESYKDGQFKTNARTGAVSKVWFSIADGVITETMYGLIHEAQIRDMRFVIKGEGYVAVEGIDTESHIDYIHKDKAGRPLSPAYRVTTRDKQGRFVIIKDIFTDPDRQSLMVRVTIKSAKGVVTPYVILDPSVANTSGNDRGMASKAGLGAVDGKTALSLKVTGGFVKATAGFTDVNDGYADVLDGLGLIAEHNDTGANIGNVRLIGQLRPVHGQAQFDFALGFGDSPKAAEASASGTLKTGYTKVLANYNGEGAYVGWEDYLASLSELKSLVSVSHDDGKLLYASAMALKVQEDHTYAGALIASLSNPWGDTVYADRSATGYKAVWPRDFYQVAMALLALGDKETPLAAFNYLPTVQVTEKTKGNKGVGGWFLQKSHVDGTLEWVGVQLDQTAMPILLGSRLYEMGIIDKKTLVAAYNSMLKPAAQFLSLGGEVNLDWNHNVITPPYSQQERWEEQEGHSPSTTAAVIAGLVAASDIARLAGDEDGAKLYSTKAKSYADALDGRLYTTNGKLQGRENSYYLRISRTENANAAGTLDERNGLKGLTADMMVDQGFIELVRYGVRPANDPKIIQSLSVIDDQTLEDNVRVRYDIAYGNEKVPGFRRYGNDGYGDRVSGGNYAVNGVMMPDQRGRVWPIFTGERGHYELALASASGPASDEAIARIRATYVRGMELMANEGLMIPEQVFEGVGAAGPHNYTVGEGTNSATPLAWSHAEYVKLLRSVRDRKVWDENSATKQAFKN